MSKITSFFKVLSHQTIRIFIQATLPCVIRRGEEDFGFQCMGDVLMRGEFLSVVEGDGVHEVADRLEATHGSLLCSAGGRTRQLDDFGQLGFALDQREQAALVSGADNGIALPVPRRALRATMVGRLEMSILSGIRPRPAFWPPRLL